MKRIILLCLALAGCADKTTSILLTDTSSGCLFAVTQYDSGSTILKPLTDAKGKQLCGVKP